MGLKRTDWLNVKFLVAFIRKVFNCTVVLLFSYAVIFVVDYNKDVVDERKHVITLVYNILR